jgi:hypothetical protein
MAEGCGRNVAKILSQHFPERFMETIKRPPSGWLASGSRIEPWNSGFGQREHLDRNCITRFFVTCTIGQV